MTDLMDVRQIVGFGERPTPSFDEGQYVQQEENQDDAEGENSDKDSTKEGDGKESEADDKKAASDRTTSKVDDEAGDKPKGAGDWKVKAEKFEAQVRDWQSKAMQSDADNEKLIATLERLTKGGGAPAQVQDGEGDELKELESLFSDLGEDQIMYGKDVKQKLVSFASKIMQGQRKSKQKEQRESLETQIADSVRKKPDFEKVQAFIREKGLSNHPDWGLMTATGRYHLARAEMRESEKTGQEERHRKELLKAKKGGLNAPPQTKGQGSPHRISGTPEDPSGVLARMAERRKARGISRQGTFIVPKK